MLARFYGFSHEEIERMPFFIMQDYLLAIESIRSVELIYQFNVETYPLMKDSDRKRLYSKIKSSIDKVIDRGYDDDRRSIEDLAKTLMRSFSIG